MKKGPGGGSEMKAGVPKRTGLRWLTCSVRTLQFHLEGSPLPGTAPLQWRVQSSEREAVHPSNRYISSLYIILSRHSVITTEKGWVLM